MEYTLLVIYKSLRLPVLIAAIIYIVIYVYNSKRKEQLERPKYRMLEED
ncbi:MAG: cbb3-type cytochrome c oxidase subunit 3 [Leptospira sp.]|nr:cbb3-type cytochrome c oxidase subunit 3 [Leptospira sp.]